MSKISVSEIILRELKKRGRITSEKIAGLAGITRQAAHRRLSSLVKNNKLLKIGATRKTYYIPYSPQKAAELKKPKKRIFLHLKNEGLMEDKIENDIELVSGPVKSLNENTKRIFRYAITEIINNAIEHSNSDTIEILIDEIDGSINFEVVDRGIGIYNKIRNKFNLKDDIEAVQELLKGKSTTAPKRHTGEGIFFTSKIADYFKIESSKICLIIDNKADDIVIKEIINRKGTKVAFKINIKTRKKLDELFKKYTGEDYKFSKTKVVVQLYERGADYISRSQARRLLFGLEKFQEIILDFKNIDGIGQSFADEVFRVFSLRNHGIRITPINANDPVLFMIKRAEAGGPS